MQNSPIVRRKVHRGNGWIKLCDDDRDQPCFVCSSKMNVRFLMFTAPKGSGQFYLRICAGCLDVVRNEEQALELLHKQRDDYHKAAQRDHDRVRNGIGDDSISESSS